MKNSIIRRAFTLTELMVAAAITAVTGLIFLTVMTLTAKGFKEVDDTLQIQNTRYRLVAHLRQSSLGARFYRLYDTYQTRRETAGNTGGQLAVFVHLHPVRAGDSYAISQVNGYTVRSAIAGRPELVYFSQSFSAPGSGGADIFPLDPLTFEADLLEKLNIIAPPDAAPPIGVVMAPLDPSITKLADPAKLHWTFFTPQAGGKTLLVTIPVANSRPDDTAMIEILTTSLAF